jgi:hypothetical protein
VLAQAASQAQHVLQAMTGIGSEDVAASANSAAADLSSLGSAP